jgi:hypothetical protein
MVRKLSTPINLPTFFLTDFFLYNSYQPTNLPSHPRYQPDTKHLLLHLDLHLHPAIVSVPCRFASDTPSTSFPLFLFHI